MDQTNVIAFPKEKVLLAEHPSGPRKIHWHNLILATGARELFLPFPGWTLPGVVGPAGLHVMAKHGWPVAGKQIVVAGTGPLLLVASAGIKKYGAEFLMIAEQAPKDKVTPFFRHAMRQPACASKVPEIKQMLSGVPYRYGVWPVRADGQDRVERVTLTDGTQNRTLACDMLACSFHLVPNVELAMALGCELDAGFVQVDQRLQTSIPDVFCAGEPTGIGGADCALVDGQVAGYCASDQVSKADACMEERDSWQRFRHDMAATFTLRDEIKHLATDDTLLCRCEDVSLGRVRQHGSWRSAKLETRCGMGACQGRICGAASRVLFDQGMESVRPPLMPARVGALVNTAVSD